ncbi:hypothetical protein KU43P_06310 [Pseudomonas sp. KU43P]|nr:hypothetical protein KU43P_06310 [Pseudomonas sp. KU43P]
MTVSQNNRASHGVGSPQRYTGSALPSFRRYAAMKIVVSASNRNPNCPWQVKLDQHVVSFRSEAEARAFVATLETRLQAPHQLMQDAWPANPGSIARH